MHRTNAYTLKYKGLTLKSADDCRAHLPFDEKASPYYADIRANLSKRGELIGSNDLLIAAIARANGVILVTRNTDEFKRVIGLQIEDWT